MDLHKRGKSNPINHDSFWPKAFMAMREPNNDTLEAKKTNKEVFNELCKENGITEMPSVINEETIYNLFERIYDNHKITLDFRKWYTSPNIYRVYRKNGWQMWDQLRIDGLRSLIINYAKANRKIDIRFIVQVRNPLDHIVSRLERQVQGRKDAGNLSAGEWRDIILENLTNTQGFIDKLNEAGLKNSYALFKLDDIILDYPSFAARMHSMIGEELDKNFYISKISLNKWHSSSEVLNLIDDRELMEKAALFGYRYKKLPIVSRFLYRIYSGFKRGAYELKLVFDTLLGKVNENNSIHNKHKVILGPLFGKTLGRTLSPFLNKHRKKYTELLSEHSKPEKK